MEDYRTFTELTEDEREELKESLYFQFVDIGDDILDSINGANDIPDCILENHYSDILFIKENFFCNM